MDSNSHMTTDPIRIVKEKDYDFLKLYIDGGFDLDLQNNSGWSALHFAAFLNDTTSVEMLLAGGANPDIVTNNGQSPLHCAVEAVNCSGKEALRSLLKYDCDMSIINHNGFHPLAAAIKTRNEQMCLDLIRAGAPLDLYGRNGITPLNQYISIERSIYAMSKSILDEMLINGVDVNKPTKDGLTPLIYASRMGSLPIINKLIDNGADPNRSVLLTSDVISSMFAYGYKLEDSGSKIYPLLVAGKENKTEAISLLMDRELTLN